MSQHCIRSLSDGDLDLILAWRNHGNIRRFMLTGHVISSREHLIWFKQSKNNKDKKLMICEDGGVPFGFVQFSGMQNPAGVVEWGFYLSPGAKRGSGKALGFLALDYIFEKSGKDQVRGQVLEKNERSIRFHERLGFRREANYTLGKSDGSGDSLICFSLMKEEFLGSKKSGEFDVH